MKFVLFVTLIWSILDSGWSITDEDLVRIEAGLAQIQVLTKKISKVEVENKELRFKMDHLKKELSDRVVHLEETCGAESDKDLVQNITIEERVTILEGEMTIIQNEVAEVEDQVAFLFDEHIIQDERLFSLEERTFILEQDTAGLEERVEVLEANGGGGGNVTALEERVETLEGTTAQHEADIADLSNTTSSLDSRVEALETETSELETRLTSAETMIEDLESTTSNLDGRVETLEGETSQLETRLTAAETHIEDLQATDVELDSRITDLEEGGGGGATNGTTIAFYASMDETDGGNIPTGSTVIFSDVRVNEGNGYDPDTGVFIVPSGGEGYYYFANHFTIFADVVYIDIRVNNVAVCTVHYDDISDTYDFVNGGCNAVVLLEEEDEVENVYWFGSDSTPVYEATDGVYNGFTGFKI